MVRTVEPLSEVNFMLLILVVRVRIVEDVVLVGSTNSRRCGSSLRESHRHLPSDCASCGGSPVETVPVLMRRIHTTHVRGVLSCASRMALSTWVTTLTSNADHRVGIGDEATLVLPLLASFDTA